MLITVEDDMLMAIGQGAGVALDGRNVPHTTASLSPAEAIVAVRLHLWESPRSSELPDLYGLTAMIMVDDTGTSLFDEQGKPICTFGIGALVQGNNMLDWIRVTAAVQLLTMITRLPAALFLNAMATYGDDTKSLRVRRERGTGWVKNDPDDPREEAPTTITPRPRAI